jgi:hypothetical protein
MKIKQLTYLLFFLLAFNNCSKENSAPPQKPMDELLVASSWKLQKMQLQIPPDQGLTDVPNLGLDPCEADDSFRFSTNNTFLMQDGVYTCNGNGRSVFWNANGGKWTFNAKDSSLIITAFPQDQKFKIKSITSASMVIYQSAKDIFGQETWYLYNLTAKN